VLPSVLLGGAASVTIESRPGLPGQRPFVAVACTLAGLGPSSPLPRTARQRQGAHSARPVFSSCPR